MLDIPVGSLLVWIFIGALVGLVSGSIFRVSRYGCLVSVIAGLVGAIIIGFLVSRIFATPPAILQGGFLVTAFKGAVAPEGGITLPFIDVFAAALGAVIVLVLIGGFHRYRRRFE